LIVDLEAPQASAPVVAKAFLHARLTARLTRSHPFVFWTSSKTVVKPVATRGIWTAVNQKSILGVADVQSGPLTAGSHATCCSTLLGLTPKTRNSVVHRIDKVHEIREGLCLFVPVVSPWQSCPSPPGFEWHARSEPASGDTKSRNGSRDSGMRPKTWGRMMGCTASVDSWLRRGCARISPSPLSLSFEPLLTCPAGSQAQKPAVLERFRVLLGGCRYR
jgi:hypothetical protein